VMMLWMGSDGCGRLWFNCRDKNKLALMMNAMAPKTIIHNRGAGEVLIADDGAFMGI
jgi:hypothetical protein